MKRMLGMLLAFALLIAVTGVLAEELQVGTNAEFPPFEYFADDGSIQGFDVDLVGAILEIDGTPFVVSSMEFDALPAALQSGLIDVAIAGMTISEEKGKSVLFSDPYFQATQKIIVTLGSAIASEQDLVEGMKVGVQLGTTGDAYVTDNLPVECVRYNKVLDAIVDMKNGRLDAVVVDAAPSAYFAQEIEGIVVLEDMLSDEYYGLAVKLGNVELMAKINAGLKIIQENGTYDAIYEKYFGVIETR